MVRFGQFLLKQPYYAAAVVLLLMVSPIFSAFTFVIAAAIVVLVTLQQGAKSGAFLLLWVALPAVVSFWFQGTTGYEALMLFCVSQYLLAVLLKEFSSWALVLEVLLMVALFAILAIHCLFPDVTAWWQSHLQSMYSSSSMLASISDSEKQLIASTFSRYATGVFAFYMMSFLFLGLLAGRFWQAAVNDQVAAFRESVLSIRVNRWVVWLAALCVLGFLFKVPMFVDSIAAVLMPFVVAAFCLLHTLARGRAGISVALVGLYIGLLFLQYIVAPLLAITAVMDAFFDFRQRLSPSTHQQT